MSKTGRETGKTEEKHVDEAKAPLVGAPPAELQNQGWTAYLVFCNITIVLGSTFMFGYNAVVINAPFAIMNTYVNESFEQQGKILTKQELTFVWSIIVTLHLVGGLLGSIWFPGALVAALGRRNSLLVVSVIGALGASCSFITPWTGTCIPLMIGRPVVGFATGLSMVIAPGLITEQAPGRLRGALGSMYALGSPIGAAFTNFLGLSFVLAKPHTWHYLFLVVVGIYVLNGLCLLLVVESPLHLIRKKQYEGAMHALMKLRGGTKEQIQAEFEEAKRVAEKAAVVKSIPLAFFFQKRQLFWPMFLTIQLHIVNQLTGLGASYFYATKVMKEAGMDGEMAALANLGISFALIFSIVLAVFIIDRFGRRPLMLAGHVLLGISNVMLTLSIAFNFILGSIAGFVLFNLAFGIGPGPIPFFMSAEVSTLDARAAALAVGMITNWMGKGTVSFIFPIMTLNIGYFSFLPFAAVSFIEFVILLLFLPETSAQLTDFDANEAFAPGRSLIKLKTPPKKETSTSKTGQTANFH